MKKRNLYEEISSLALSRGKMAFISGPRQVGKTTLSKEFLKLKSDCYYNWDSLDFRKVWTKSPATSIDALKKENTVIFDEIHKAVKWKQNIKGIYDSIINKPKIIVTGSARLDLYKKGSDSLMGRYLGFRLHPFSIGELHNKSWISPADLEDLIHDGLSNKENKQIQTNWKTLNEFGGFPEPFLSSSKKILNIWQRGRIEKIVREDLRDLSRIPELSKIEMLISLLPEKVSNPISITALKEDLEVSYDTVKRWMEYLRQLYYHFEIKPWSKKISRSIKKESKIYLWDWSEVQDPGARFENMVASHLLKACHYWSDTGEGDFQLHFLKTKEKKEVDFLITKNNSPWMAFECKLSNANPSKNFQSFSHLKSIVGFIQLVNKPKALEINELENNRKLIVVNAPQFFKHLP